ncbi:MAG TPA: hypothetical protein EYN22_02945 [Nitrospinaceae bacterium]|nr:hypothetical protein [Nitrospinaceae bacterium]
MMIRLLCITIIFFGFNASYIIQTTNASPKLGKVEFPASGSKEAQQHFIRGVAALHSFWYTEAIDSFQKSTKADPNFAMGYWGEAMAHNAPLWERQDSKSAKAALSKISDLSELTQREQDYIQAVQILYGEGEKLTRDKAYSNAMRGVYIKYPNDLEAACFYSLSLLGVARNAKNKLKLQVEAGAIALDVFQQNPSHPCASHYAIHAFDNPDLARLALPSAQRYAKIAPSSHHAQHMPAHIFVQLGMWPEAAKSNENGWATSKKWVEREKLPKSKRDYHSLQWLHYVYLQQGLIDKAEAIFKIQQKDMREGIQAAEKSKPNPNLRSGKYYYRMLAAAVIETEQWEKTKQLIPPEGWEPKTFSKAGYSFVRGYAAAMQGNDEAKKHVTELKVIREKGFRKNHFSRSEYLEVWELEIKAAIKLYEKDYEAAIQLAKKATLVEEKLPSPTGPPRILKPTYELLGEVYLKAGKPKKAKDQFTISLARHPNRIRSLIGTARSAKLDGNKITAKENYSQILSVLKNADPGFPELKEAKVFLESF